MKPHNFVNLLLFVLLCILSPIRVQADDTWCAVTDNNHIIALSNINYLFSTEDSEKFNIVLNDGSAITEVLFITFSMFHIDSIIDIAQDKNIELSISGNKIIIYNAKIGSPLSIYDINGRNMMSLMLQGDKQEIDISSLTSGIYILNVDGKPTKFKRL